MGLSRNEGLLRWVAESPRETQAWNLFFWGGGGWGNSSSKKLDDLIFL